MLISPLLPKSGNDGAKRPRLALVIAAALLFSVLLILADRWFK